MTSAPPKEDTACSHTSSTGPVVGVFGERSADAAVVDTSVATRVSIVMWAPMTDERTPSTTFLFLVSRSRSPWNAYGKDRVSTPLTMSQGVAVFKRNATDGCDAATPASTSGHWEMMFVVERRAVGCGLGDDDGFGGGEPGDAVPEPLSDVPF